MKTQNRKALIEAYKNKPMIGAIYYIECSGNNHRWIKLTKDLNGARNKFDFAVATMGSPEPSMRQEWIQFGIDSFSFHVVEELKKKDTLTENEFSKILEEHYDMWCEKL